LGKGLLLVYRSRGKTLKRPCWKEKGSLLKEKEEVTVPAPREKKGKDTGMVGVKKSCQTYGTEKKALPDCPFEGGGSLGRCENKRKGKKRGVRR